MKVRLVLALAGVAVVAGLVGLRAQTSGVVVIEGATVIDAVSAAPIRNAAVVVENGVIKAIGQRGAIAVPSGARHVDLSGRTIIPGMIEAHTHLAGGPPAAEGSSMPPGGAIERNADRYLFYGFTHVMSLGLDGPAMDAYLAKQKAGQTTGARVLFAGFGFSQKEGWQAQNPSLHRPDTPEEARAMVRQEIARNVDGIKFWFDDDHGKLPKLPVEVYSAIIDEAHKNGRKVFCHEFRLDDSKELVRHGLDVLAHSIRDREVDDEFLQLARQRNVTYITTLVGHASVYTFSERPGFLDDPGLPMLFSGTLLSTLSSRDNQQKVAADPRVPVVKQEVAIAEKNAAKVAATGINIAIGTDAGPSTVLFGLADHLEMEWLVKAGMTPMQVIKAATINGAKVLGLDKDYGTLETGKAADFVVLAADPLTNITNTRKIEAVWVAGNPVDRSALASGTAKP